MSQVKEKGMKRITVKEQRFGAFSLCRCRLLKASDGSRGTSPTEEGANSLISEETKMGTDRF